MRMKDRVALVTGAGGPMGMAVAKRFAEEGASLVITDISATRLAEGERAVVDATGSAGKVVALRTNAMVRGELEDLVAAGREKFGSIQILANIVGGYQGQHYEGPADLVHMTEARWDATMQLNLKPGFHLVQLLAPAMLENDYGKILNISSINFAGEAGSADYGAAKAAVARDIPAGETQLGYPAGPESEQLRILIAQKRLPDLIKTVKTLLKRIDRLETQLADATEDGQDSGPSSQSSPRAA